MDFCAKVQNICRLLIVRTKKRMPTKDILLIFSTAFLFLIGSLDLTGFKNLLGLSGKTCFDKPNLGKT